MYGFPIVQIFEKIVAKCCAKCVKFECKFAKEVKRCEVTILFLNSLQISQTNFPISDVPVLIVVNNLLIERILFDFPIDFDDQFHSGKLRYEIYDKYLTVVNVKKEQSKFQSTIFVPPILTREGILSRSCHSRQTFIPASCLFHLRRNSRKLGLSQIAKAPCATSLKLKGRLYSNSLPFLEIFILRSYQSEKIQ